MVCGDRSVSYYVPLRRGGVAGLLENVAGLFIVLLLLIGLEKALRKRTE
jgi:hypothetical protein